MTDIEERTLKCYLLHTGAIGDESEFEGWYQQRHQGPEAEQEYKVTLAEAKAWLEGSPGVGRQGAAAAAGSALSRVAGAMWLMTLF